MSIQDKWLEQFKAAVSHEIARANGKESDGYRAIAAKTHLGYDYIYQIYKGKPLNKPKMPGSEAMDAINREYGDVIVGSSLAVNKPESRVDSAQPATKDIATLAQITEALAGYFEVMDASTRKMAIGLIGQLADDPQDHSRIAAMIELSIHSKRPKAA